MNHILIPSLFFLYLLSGWVLAEPPEPYMSYDYETEEFVLIEPQDSETIVIYNEDMDASIELIADETPDEIWTIDPDTSELKMYEKN